MRNIPFIQRIAESIMMVNREKIAVQMYPPIATSVAWSLTIAKRASERPKKITERVKRETRRARNFAKVSSLYHSLLC